MRRAYARWLLVAALAAGSATSAGCANDQETVNRVQPNALQKSSLTGEWYTLGTIVDTQVDAPVAVGFPVGFDRIKWDIQEDYLIARRTYTAVRNVEDNSLTDDNETTSVVAMYAIDSHFDIRRDYNPSTGEQTNVIGENTTDRPWYQRDFMRVDWSQNLLDSGQLAGGVTIKPVALFDQDQGEEEKAELAPHFETDADGNLTYFDLSNKFWAEPPMQDYDSDGDGKNDTKVAVCGFVMNMQMDCSPGAVTLRYSFAKVEDHDYQPMEYTADRQTRFGYFLTKRDGYDLDYGIAVSGRRAFTNRHNIWQASHIKDAAGKYISCSAGDVKKEEAFRAGASKDKSACMAADAASRCDWDLARANGTSEGQCLIPYTQREVRPIVYYTTSNMPKTLMPDVHRVGDEWNRAFTEAVASMRRLECEANSGKNCGQYTAAKTERMYVTCSNPVAKGDHEACGPENFAPRYGDVRYSFISWVSEPHSKFAGAPLGLGPSFADPVTGEIRSGYANLYGEGFETLASYARDILAMMHGDLTPTDAQSNAAFAAWQQKQRTSAIADTSAREADRHVIPLDAYDMAEANDDMSFGWALDRLPKYNQPATPAFIKQTAKQQWKAISQMHENLAFGREGRGKLQELKGSYIEDMLLGDEYNIQAGVMPGQTMTEDEVNRVSPLSYGGAFGIRGRLDAQKALMRSPAGQNMPCLVSVDNFADDGLLGLLQEIETAASKGDGVVQWSGVKYHVSKNGKIDYDLVREMVKHPSFFGLTAHEVGHSLGLTHNFSGSYDALNYDPQYWKLRAADKTIRSRASDPMTTAESKGHIREFQYSTVMDYGNNFIVSDARGIGHYDVAAIKMGYGDVAEVFTKAPKANVGTIAQLDAQAFPFSVFLLDPRTGNELSAFHYTQWPELVGGVANISERADVLYKDLSFVESPLFGDGGYSIYEKNGKSYPVVPYIYCYDIFQGSRPNCNVYDAGADAYESTMSIIDNYWDYYPFSNFQRGRLGWDPSSVPARSVGRYLDKLAQFAHTYALYRSFLEPYTGAEFFEQEDGFGLYTLGVRATYDLFRKIISTPEPGTSLLMEELVTGERIVSSDPGGSFLTAAPFGIDTFNGRALRSDWEIGPSFEFINFSSSGWFKEKQLAMEIMLWADTGSLGRDTEPDVREYSSSFYTIFQDSMSEFMRAIYAGDVLTYAPRHTAKGDLVYPSPEQIVQRGTTMKGDVVSPNVAFTLQLSAMTYGMTLIPNTFDQDFVNHSRVYVAGSSEAVDIDPTKTVSFLDERSGMTYYAPSFVSSNVKDMEGIPLETAPGAAMINMANALKARVDEAVEAGDAATADKWRAKLNDYLDNLDIARYLGHRVGHGSDGDFLYQ